MENMKDIKIDIKKLTKIPTLSHTADKILHLTSNELTHLDLLVTIIEKDPPIMSKVLSIANLVYFGNFKPITSVKDALLKLGFKILKNIALSVSIFSIFHFSKEKEISYRRLFKHSIATAIACKFISEKLLDEYEEENFTAGMLHDIGLFIVHSLFYDRFLEIEKLIEEGLLLREAEQRTIGITHGEIGSLLIETWGLPGLLIDVVLYHNDLPNKSVHYSKNVALVQLANYLAIELDYSPFSIKFNTTFYENEVRQILGIQSIEDIGNQLIEPLRELENL